MYRRLADARDGTDRGEGELEREERERKGEGQKKQTSQTAVCSSLAT
jgi:hypothetical protein